MTVFIIRQQSTTDMLLLQLLLYKSKKNTVENELSIVTTVFQNIIERQNGDISKITTIFFLYQSTQSDTKYQLQWRINYNSLVL